MVTRVFTKTILPSKLHQELTAAVPDIFQGILYEADTAKATINLTQEPTGTEDETILNIVNNHVPSRKNYKIWEMVQNARAPYVAPLDVDFDLLPLAIKKTYDKGEEDIFTYYRSATINPDGTITYSDPILRTEWEWTHDPQNFPVYAEEKVRWYYEDDTLGPAEKIIPHYFDGLHKIRKGKEARGIRIDDMQIPIISMIIYNETARRAGEESNPTYTLTAQEMDAALQIGRDFLTTNQSDFTAYIEHRDLKLITTVTNATEDFLDWVNPFAAPTTIRDYILNELS